MQESETIGWIFVSGGTIGIGLAILLIVELLKRRIDGK